VNTKINSYDLVVARCFLALIFVVEGISKIADADATRHYMLARHLPGGLLWPVIIFEIGSGLLTAVGYQTRVVAAALTVYCLLTAAIFHTSLSDQVQNLMLLKNIAMAGGFMLLSYVGGDQHRWQARNPFIARHFPKNVPFVMTLLATIKHT
jgi:putative oxidoreductase